MFTFPLMHLTETAQFSLSEIKIVFKITSIQRKSQKQIFKIWKQDERFLNPTHASIEPWRFK